MKKRSLKRGPKYDNIQNTGGKKLLSHVQVINNIVETFIILLRTVVYFYNLVMVVQSVWCDKL